MTMTINEQMMKNLKQLETFAQDYSRQVAAICNDQYVKVPWYKRIFKK